MNMREYIGLTREELAERAGISEKFLYEIELGKKGFSVTTLKKLTEALGVSSDYIIFGESKTKNNLSKIISIINKYDSRQIGNLTEILENIYDISKK